MNSGIINLQKNFFQEKEKLFLDFNGLKASLFIYPSGVESVKLENERGSIIVLPYQGQQVWDAQFDGRRLTMKTMFPYPKKTQQYLHTYGAFVIYCGALRMGNPGPEDSHPLHGELPNAEYEDAAVIYGEDEGGEYIGLTGRYIYTEAFASCYHAIPVVKLYRNSTVLYLAMTIQNQSAYPMELMFMYHINFRPVDNGRIVQSFRWSPETMEVRTSIPKHVKVSQEFLNMLEEVKRDPKTTEVIKPGVVYRPELVMFLTSPISDTQGWSHNLQVHLDGSADYVAYRPRELDHVTRWMVRTLDKEALGLILPATCDPEGYTAEKKKGNIKEIPAQSSAVFHARAGLLDRAQAAKMEKTINDLVH